MFKIMAQELQMCDLPSNSLDEETHSASKLNENNEKQACLLFSAESEIGIFDNKVLTFQSETSSGAVDKKEQPSLLEPPASNLRLKAKNAAEKNHTTTGPALNPKLFIVNDSNNKENAAVPPPTPADIAEEEGISNQSSRKHFCAIPRVQSVSTEEKDAEVARRAQEEGRVDVIFPGSVTQDGCCRFVSEILKCVLYQRQQLPMTYDQLVYSQKKQQEKHAGSVRPGRSADLAWRRCQQTLEELEEVLQHLEVLFSLSRVPRVLLLLGGSIILPRELYEINMEAVVVATGDQCLRVSSCLRQLFRNLFVADLLSDTRPVRLMPTTVLALAHRNCGVAWFRPKLQFKVPTRVKNRVITLSTDSSSHKELKLDSSDWQDYVWFQAPMTIKGFTK